MGSQMTGALLLVAAMLTGCADANESSSSGDAEVDGEGGTPSRDSGHSAADGSGPASEVCNRLDDDGNGIIDDVDTGGDGICDCLSIATLGIPGKWGEGEIFADWLEGKSDAGAVHLTPLVVAGDSRSAEDQPLTPELLAPFQLLVVQDVSVLDDFSGAEIAALQDWVTAGGGLMTLIGYGDSTERTNVNSLLAPMGLRYEPEQILGAGSARTVPVTEWASHPTSDEVSRIGIDNGYEVAADGAATIVAREGGLDVALAAEVGGGKAFMWGDEWITYNSEWADTDYQVERFWLNVIKWLTPAGECQVPILI